MGGYGSGRTGGWPTVEGCQSLVLSIDATMSAVKWALLKVSGDQTLHTRDIDIPWHPRSWTRYGEDEPWAVVEMRLELRQSHGTAWLRYDVDHFNRPTGPQEYPVRLTTSPCRFGGVRWWFVCPATGRKVAKLYLPNGGTRFLSRGHGAYMLAYASQRDSVMNRMHTRNRKLFHRLGAAYPDLSNYWPPKPKGMHWRTYDNIIDRLNDAETRMDRELLLALPGLLRLVNRER